MWSNHHFMSSIINNQGIIMSYAYAFFNQLSGNSIVRATENFKGSIEFMTTPYYSLSSNLQAFGHPFCHAFQFFINLCRFGQSLFGIIESLVLGLPDGSKRASNHMALFAAAAVFEIANIVLSVVSLATRFVASVLNLGYVSCYDSLEFEACAPNGSSVALSEISDTSIHEAAFHLIF